MLVMGDVCRLQVAMVVVVVVVVIVVIVAGYRLVVVNLDKAPSLPGA